MIYTAEYIIDFLNLRNYTEEQINNYIEHFTATIKRRAKTQNTKDQLFQDAVLAAIACKISREDKTALIAPTKTEIGDYTEENQAFLNDSSFCDLAKEALEELINSLNSSFGFKVFKRQSASEKRGFYQ